MVEGVHFLPDTEPSLLAKKVLRANLSDLAAMAARPSAYSLNLSLPEHTSEMWLAQFSRGLSEDQQHFGIHLIGGDTTATHGPIVITITAFGYPMSHEGPKLRRMAKPGHHLWVSGTIGDAALGLKLLTGKYDSMPAEAFPHFT